MSLRVQDVDASASKPEADTSGSLTVAGVDLTAPFRSSGVDSSAKDTEASSDPVDMPSGGVRAPSGDVNVDKDDGESSIFGGLVSGAVATLDAAASAVGPPSKGDEPEGEVGVEDIPRCSRARLDVSESHSSCGVKLQDSVDTRVSV